MELITLLFSDKSEIEKTLAELSLLSDDTDEMNR